ncbi:MAG: fumarylacetoacetate hydrolase family protein, partial [Pseudomonadota bacterium]
NDVSGRDMCGLEIKSLLGLAKGKDKDGWNQMGPYLVTPDEWDFRDEHQMIVRVNGEVWGGGPTTSVSSDPAEALSYLSRHETLYPGDVIGFGTVGTGTGADIGRWPQAGDVVEMEVEGIGVLRSRFVRPG